MTMLEAGAGAVTAPAPGSAPAAGAGLADPVALPGLRLLRGLRPDGLPMSLDDHVAAHGRLPLSGDDLLAVVEASGLRGRGGAGFPLATKLRVARESSSMRRRPLVVVNAAESEPASRKDFVLATRSPHLILDGAAAAARVIGATEAVLWVHRGHSAVVAALTGALAERAAAGLAGPSFRLVEGPPRYVSGQATAVVAFLSGRPAVPFTSPVPMARRGLGGRPTLVSNAETLAQLALVLRHGAAAFRSAGTPSEPGTILATVLGVVASPGVVEVPVATPVRDLLAAAGGTTRAVGALLVGGYAGSWLAPSQSSAPYSRAGLAPAGADPGVPMVVALPADTCPVAETARLVAWLADERVGQCGPCLNGLPALASEMRLLATGSGDCAGSPLRLRRWAGMVEGRGACHHPDGAVRLVTSLLGQLGDEVARHAAGEHCRAGVPTLVLPARGDGTWR